MANAKKRLQEIEQKLRRLLELKAKIKQQEKRERKKAEKYLRQYAYCRYYSAMNGSSKEEVRALLLECLQRELCPRSKRKMECVKRKLEMIAEHFDFAKEDVAMVIEKLENGKGGS